MARQILLILAVAILCCIDLSLIEARVDNSGAACPCSNASYCEPIVYNKKELYGLVLNSTAQEWATYNFTKLTTVIMLDFFDIQLVCLAHQHGVRVLTRETFSLADLSNQTITQQWIGERVKFAATNYLDGIDLYVDDPLEKNSPLVNKLNDFATEVVAAFRFQLPESIVVFSVPYSPYNVKQLAVDGKNYDYLTLSKIVDQLFVMDYDQRRQSFDEPCLAGAIDDYFYTVGGLLAYKNLTLDMNKIVLGLPAYGHDYSCTNYGQNLRCYIDPSEFRGVNCSSNVAKVVPLNQLNSLLTSNKAINFYDEHSNTYMSEYFDYSYGYVHQVFYDGQGSLMMNVQFAMEQGARGMGLHVLNYIDKSIWKYLPDYRDQ